MPYEGGEQYEPLYHYLKQAEQLLTKRGNKATLHRDQLTSASFREYGRDVMIALKKNNYNLKLEELVIGMNHSRMIDVVDGHFVPRTGLIFLTPRSTCGRAPFYSSVKILGDHPIRTLWFNISVLLLMCLCVALLLFTDVPGRYLRKEDNS